MRKEGLGTDAVVRRTGRRRIFATKRFGADFQICLGRRDPAQLHAIVAVLVANKGLVGQRSIAEIIGVRVMTVEVADVRVEAPGARGESIGQGSGLDIRFLDACMRFAIFAFQSQGELAVELVVDVRRKGNLALAEQEAIRARPAFTDQRKAGTPVIERILGMVDVEAIEDQGNGRIEGVGRRIRGRCRRFVAARNDDRILPGGFHLLQFGLRSLGRGQCLCGLLLQGLRIGLQGANALGQGGNPWISPGFGRLGRAQQSQGKNQGKRLGSHRNSVTAEGGVRDPGCPETQSLRYTITLTSRLQVPIFPCAPEPDTRSATSPC